MYALIGSIITGVLALIGVIYTSKKTADKTTAQIQAQVEMFHLANESRTDLIQKDIINLNKNVEKHNKVIERVYEAEAQIRVIESRLNELEK